MVPGGTATLGTSFSPIKGVKLSSIHADPPSLIDQSTTAGVMDPLALYVHGGKIGLLGGAGVRKTMLTQELVSSFSVMCTHEGNGARACVVLTGLTIPEYFRDEEGQDVLLFIDNVLRFIQAVSALLGRITPAVGYQPTLSTNMGAITSVQGVYPLADDLNDPAVAATVYLDATTMLSRGISELGIYPAVDPLVLNPIC